MERICGKQINTLILGFDYAIEKDPKHYINELVIDTEYAIDAKIQNTFRYLPIRKIKQIIETNKQTQHITQKISI